MSDQGSPAALQPEENHSNHNASFSESTDTLSHCGASDTKVQHAPVRLCATQLESLPILAAMTLGEHTRAAVWRPEASAASSPAAQLQTSDRPSVFLSVTINSNSPCFVLKDLGTTEQLVGKKTSMRNQRLSNWGRWARRLLEDVPAKN